MAARLLASKFSEALSGKALHVVRMVDVKIPDGRGKVRVIKAWRDRSVPVTYYPEEG
jgi:hypothetical protein